MILNLTKNELSRYLVPISMLASKVARLFAVFYLMSLIAPIEFSLWITISLIMQYSLYLQMGVPAPTSRELSISYGKKNLNEMISIAALSIQVYIIASIVLFFLILNFYNGDHPIEVFWYVTLSHGAALFLMHNRTTFKNLSVISANFLESLIIFCGIYFFNVKDPILSLINIYIYASIVTILICLPSFSVLKKALSIKYISLSEFKKIFIYAFPLMIFNIFVLFKGTWDIFYIKFLNLKGAEIYISSQIFGNTITILTALIALIFVPHIGRIFGKYNESVTIELINEVKNYEKFSVITFLLGLIMLYPILLLIFNYFLPQYYEFIDIYFLRTIALLLGIIAIPRLVFLNTLRKLYLSNTILCLSVLVGIVSYQVIILILSTHISFILAVFISNLFCFISSVQVSSRVINSEFALQPKK